jgi:2-polyprenyl-6-hydroxyphenyl methylase/3-demethylubiquinone-9 3-methyltransferase
MKDVLNCRIWDERIIHMDATKIAVIDNEIYDRRSDLWWSERGFASMLEHVSNPWRVPYFQRIIACERKIEPDGIRLLDVGCGGGVLAEEFAAMGFEVTGIDPSQRSLDAASSHAAERGLRIDYRVGHGDRLLFGDETFEVVSCCDVLEHISNWDEVIAEVARVLRSGGIFFYDTINRTMISKLVFIKLGQEWKFTRFLPPNMHVWEMFIKPEELTHSLDRHGLRNMDIKGTRPGGNPLKMVAAMYKYNRGRISAAEFGKRIGGSVEGPNIDVNYMGYAIKP